MGITFTHIAKGFTPAETEAVTGVSVAQQRDWRRRGLIPEKENSGWTRFDVEGIIDLSVLRFFTLLGFPPSSLSTVRQLAVLPTISRIYEHPSAFEFTAAVSPGLRDTVLSRAVHGARSHILVVTSKGESETDVARLSNYSALDQHLDTEGTPNCVILDCHKLADYLVKTVDGPLYRVEVEEE